MTSTLWRTVESHEEAAFGLVSRHPRHVASNGEEDVRYFLRSRVFAAQFQHITGAAVFQRLAPFCFGSRGPIGSSEVVITDIDRVQHLFFVETFFNSHDALTLGLYRGVRVSAVAVPQFFRG